MNIWCDQYKIQIFTQSNLLLLHYPYSQQLFNSQIQMRAKCSSRFTPIRHADSLILSNFNAMCICNVNFFNVTYTKIHVPMLRKNIRVIGLWCSLFSWLTTSNCMRLKNNRFNLNRCLWNNLSDSSCSMSPGP